VGSGGVGEGEPGSEVATELGDLLDVVEQLPIDTLLHSLKLGPPLGLMGLALLSSLQPVLRGVLELVLGEPLSPLEEGVIDVGSDAIERDSGLGGEDVGGVYSAERDSVDGVRTSNQQIS